jgi:hypothetical protein
MRIWGKVLLWWAGAGVLSSGAESFQVFPQACVEVPCRGGRGGKVGERWVVLVLVSRREVSVGGRCWRSVGQSASERLRALGGDWRTGDCESAARQEREQAVCQGEMGSRGERRRQTSNAERVKGGERWQTRRRSALWLGDVVVVMM